MDKQILNTLNDGEHIVEIKEYMFYNRTVYNATVYTCHKKWWGKRFKKYEFPFYFARKELVTDFLKYWDNFYIYRGEYYDNDVYICYMLGILNNNTYWLVDYFKELGLTATKTDKFQMDRGGVWNGKLNTDGRYYTYESYNKNYKEILNNYNVIPVKTDNVYTFKMIK